VYRRFIAFKYLSSRFITFAALLTVACGVALLIVILSVMEGFRTDLEDRIRGISADIRVASKSFIGLKDAQAVAAKIQAVSGVRSVVPYVETLAMSRIRGESDFEYFSLQALDLAREAEVGSLSEYLEAARKRAGRSSSGERQRTLRWLGGRLAAVAGQPARLEELLSPQWLEKKIWDLSGELPPPGPPLPPILVGYETMEYLGLAPGRTIRLTSYSPVTSRDCSADFLVAGVFFSRDFQFDSRTLLLPLASAVDFLELRDPQTGRESISGIRVTLAPGVDLDQAKERVREAAAEVPFVQVKSWREEKASLLRAVRIEKTVVGIILGVLIFFAGFMIFIVLTVQVVEKTRDLGILQSLGSTSRGIAGIFLFIGSVVCVVGTLLGTFLGVALSLSVNTVLRWIYLLSGYELFPRSLYYIDRIPVKLSPVDLNLVVWLTCLVSLLASLVPAYWAARKDPVVALRYE
jgi:lipoprotein-releasing system permease protein